jgi:hypothetical protein
MGFNRNDLQGDDNDDFSFDDDFNPENGGDSDFNFDEMGGPGDQEGGFGFDDEEMPPLEEDAGAGGPRGPNRTFVVLAVVMIILFILGLGAVVLISALNSSNQTPIDETRSAIETINANTVAQLVQTQTAAPLIALTGTQEALQIALAQTQTASAPTATPIQPTATPTASLTPTPPLDETQLAATTIAQQTQQAGQVALALTQTALFASPTPGQPSVSDVALTATALVLLLQPPGQGGGEVPTQEVIGGQTPIGPIPTALPQTGFFDDLAAGNANIGLIALLALGLVGVIGVSRYLRTANNSR